MQAGDERWAAVERYLVAELQLSDAELEAAVAANAAAGLPAIDVDPAMGKLLLLLAQIQGAQKILELGTLGGYSTIWLARALPAGGRLVTLELDPEHAAVAQANIARAGLADVVEVRVGPALELLPEVAAAGLGPFDLIFIDADKQSTPDYFTWALELSRTGSLIVVDNVVRGGSIIDGDNTDANVNGMRRFLAMVGAEPRVSATAIQTVGSKRHDGFVLARVLA